MPKSANSTPETVFSDTELDFFKAISFKRGFDRTLQYRQFRVSEQPGACGTNVFDTTTDDAAGDKFSSAPKFMVVCIEFIDTNNAGDGVRLQYCLTIKPGL